MAAEKGRESKKILVVSNDWPLKMAGGSNTHMLKVIQYWTDNEVDILLPRLGLTYAQRDLKVTGKIIVTDSFFEREMPSVFGDPLLKFSRMFRVLLAPPQKKIRRGRRIVSLFK